MKDKIEMQILDSSLPHYINDPDDCIHRTFEHKEQWIGNLCTTSPMTCIDCGYSIGEEKKEIKDRPFHIVKGRFEYKKIKNHE